MKQAAFIEFCKRWMERDRDIAKNFGVSENLLNKCEQMLLREGLCHSNQNTNGIFTDQYQRCAYIKDPKHSLLYLTIEALSNYFAMQKEYLIPICDVELAKNILEASNTLVTIDFHCSLEDHLEINGTNIVCIRARKISKNAINDPSLIFNLLKYIANWGALATQDTLIHILLYLSPIDISKQDEQSSAIVNDKLNVSIFDAIKILHDAPAAAQLSENDFKSFEFYCKFLEQFLIGFYKTMQQYPAIITPEENFLCMQALRRLHLKLLILQDSDTDYQTSMVSLEFAFDEIVNLLSVFHPYSKNDLFDAIKSLSCSTLHLSKDAPTTVSLAGSCMQAIHRKIGASLKYLRSSTGNEELKVFFSYDMYFEIFKALELDQDFQQHKLVTFRGLKAQYMQSYKNQIVDLMLLNFHANVNRRKRGFTAHDLQAMIENQYALRNQQGSSKQLIVIIDGTMTNLTGDHMPKLLATFKKQIDSGKLAVLLVSSLNKYLHIGFDRFPSGISIEFYAKEHFVGLTKDELVSFETNNAIPQTVTHFLRNVGDNLAIYYDMVHQFSRNLHDNIVPKYLYCDDQPIRVDNPYTQDSYQNPWGFMVIRFADENITAKYKPILEEYLNNIGIAWRDGFGFNKSTYSSIGANLEVLRICIGPNSSEAQYKNIVNFIEEQNNCICCQPKSARLRLA